MMVNIQFNTVPLRLLSFSTLTLNKELEHICVIHTIVTHGVMGLYFIAHWKVVKGVCCSYHHLTPSSDATHLIPYLFTQHIGDTFGTGSQLPAALFLYAIIVYILCIGLLNELFWLFRFSFSHTFNRLMQFPLLMTTIIITFTEASPLN